MARATTSLWTDEIHTILYYSSKGPWVTVTDYHEPNNHVFFNLVNSVTPGRSSVEPLRARLWSFAAMGALLILGLMAFLAKDGVVWGAVLVWVLSSSRELVDLNLQARGYGLVAFFALVVCWATAEFLERGGVSKLVWLGGASALDSWTVPTFGFFVAGIWICLIGIRRISAVLVVAALSGLGTIGLHAPILGQMLDQARHYDERWGRQYASVIAVADTARIYLFHPTVLMGRSLPLYGVLIVGASLIVGSFLVWRIGKKVEVPAVVVGAVVIFFLICLTLETPLLRSTAFAVVPIAFAAAYVAMSLSHHLPTAVRMGLVLIVAIAIGRQSIRNANSYAFLPEESWKELADVIHETFPVAFPFVTSANGEFLAGYLDNGDRPSSTVDLVAWGKGEQVYLETPVDDPVGGRVNGSEYAPSAVEFRIPQRRASYLAMWFCPPRRSLLSGAIGPGGSQSLEELTDRELATGATAAKAGRVGRPPFLDIAMVDDVYRSMVVVAGEDAELEAEVLRPKVLAGEHLRVRHFGRTALVSLGDRQISLVRIRPGRRMPPEAWSIREVWAYPTSSLPKGIGSRESTESP